MEMPEERVWGVSQIAYEVGFTPRGGVAHASAGLLISDYALDGYSRTTVWVEFFFFFSFFRFGAKR